MSTENTRRADDDLDKGRVVPDEPVSWIVESGDGEESQNPEGFVHLRRGLLEEPTGCIQVLPACLEDVEVVVLTVDLVDQRSLDLHT